jgi:phage terminase large subunit GpA-like protein
MAVTVAIERTWKLSRIIEMRLYCIGISTGTSKEIEAGSSPENAARFRWRTLERSRSGSL